MKRINLLPQPSWWERYQRLRTILFALVVGTSLSLCMVWFYFGLSTPSMTSADLLQSSTQCSVDKLKVVGYLHQGEGVDSQTLSLIAFPNEQIVTVKADDTIGAEAAKVIEIQPTSTVVKLPDTKQIVNIRSATHD